MPSPVHSQSNPSKQPDGENSSWLSHLLERFSKLGPVRRTGILLLLALLLLGSIASSFVLWPKGDEADLVLQSRLLSEGKLPYRDFFTFIPPLSHTLTALIIGLMGVNLTGIRLLILCGWLLEMLLLFRLARFALPPIWAGLLVGFLWFTNTRYLVNQHHFWSGLVALLSVYGVFRSLQESSKKESDRADTAMSWAGFSAGLTPWFTQSLGALMLLAFGLFSIVDTHRSNPSNAGHFWSRWLNRWGMPFFGPALFVGVIMLLSLLSLGILDDFYRDSIQWLMEGHYLNTTTPGYFPTFQEEWTQTLLPLLENKLSWDIKALFLVRLPVALHLVLIGLFPLLGLGYGIIHCYRHRQTAWHAHTAFWWLVTLSALAMIGSTLSYATSMHLVSNSGLAFLLAFSGLYAVARACPGWSRLIQNGLLSLYALLWLAATVGCAMHLTLGVWLPRFQPMRGQTLYTAYIGQAQAMLDTINLLNQAAAQGRSVLVISQSPELYLAGNFQNPTRYTLILPIYTSESQIREVLDDLDRKKPLMIADDHALGTLRQDSRFSAYPDTMLRIPALRDYIGQHYRRLETYGRYTVYVRISN